MYGTGASTLRRGLETCDDFDKISFFFEDKFVSILGLTLTSLLFLAFLSGLGLVELLATLAVSDSSLIISGGGGGCE